MSETRAAPQAVRIAEAKFTAGAAKREQVPAPSVPEVAFAGRSNVGKSSLLNMLLARRSLARTSGTPGCTRQINFFDVVVAKGPKLVFVDLPGYGYAKVSKSEARGWRELLESYLQGRASLRAVVVLVDVRRGLLEEEQALLEFLGLRPDLVVVVAATKLDKLARNAQKPALAKIAKEAERLAGPKVRVVGTSAESGEGREALWKRLLSAVGEATDVATSA